MQWSGTFYLLTQTYPANVYDNSTIKTMPKNLVSGVGVNWIAVLGQLKSSFAVGQSKTIELASTRVLNVHWLLANLLLLQCSLAPFLGDEKQWPLRRIIQSIQLPSKLHDRSYLYSYSLCQVRIHSDRLLDLNIKNSICRTLQFKQITLYYGKF